MKIDVVAAILIVVAILHGYRRGLITAIFSFVAVIIGIAAAMKFSVSMGRYLEVRDFHSRWLPFISFLLVFGIAVFFIRLGALFLQKTMEMLWMGWLNKVAGIVFYAAMYLTIFSVLLFFADKTGLLGSSTIRASATYPYLKKIGPWFVDHLGKIVPWFGNMFHDLSTLFAGLPSETVSLCGR